ncbi:B12-binding domain-containing radical SAM protein [Opitutales bacterium ASA1]|uniref:lipid biosynthesis B12-binding/radical SAM protein n=1 Tax=Congregicoccus parvus TaxID=3081749 RepID=UPI002B2A9717|nr:B12-binding domain-containing radical SAM protein [Opitutales bacterium ASA1]
MPARVLLVSANTCNLPEAVFPLGLAHVSAALQQAGHETLWFDVQIPGATLADTLREFRPDAVGISLRNIDDVQMASQETYYDGVAGMCALVRAVARCPVVLGGSGFSMFPERLLAATGAEYGVVGAGEDAFPRLLEALARGEPPEDVPGVLSSRGGTPPSPSVSTLSIRCATDRPPEIVAHYLRHAGMLNLQTQRGCACRCCYCTYPLLEGRRRLGRDPREVAEEMASLAAAGARYVFVVDSIFNSSREHVLAICEAIVRRKPGVAWGCFLRPQGLDAEQARAMARAGLTHAEFGSDSFSDTVLRAYHKGFRFDDVLHSHRLLRDVRVSSCHFFIAGGPGETMETLEESLNNAELLEDTVIVPCVGMRIYPGTWLHRLALKEGRIDSETDLLRPVYYLAENLVLDRIESRLREHGRRAPHWMLRSDSGPFLTMVARLRDRGIAGPLWSYFSVLQRLTPSTGV